MTMTDPIADLLTRLRNANTAFHDDVLMPSSKVKEALAKILVSEDETVGAVGVGLAIQTSPEGSLSTFLEPVVGSVPLGEGMALASLINTAAFESNRIEVPSLRRVSLRMRTITQRTTFPFLIAESGAASFTAAVITSPSPARNPRSPPRGRMQESFRAPELSATSRIVRIPIIKIAPFRSGGE